ncbi:hypothetical protein [Nocardia amikacinitolerans]|uniref:hypothetical protein n=1 Tax=Nocardia amikacinitolerans TaxID=756689 RepID=UPI0020A2B467|nr:hypothetical protein [Nocardia amikacinitolerans]MCP2288381.1 hypothetical protein [Nocardia amikacinitolerans]
MNARFAARRDATCCGTDDPHLTRPTRRLAVLEAWCGLVLGSVTLPWTSPAAGAVPEWVQLIGLAMLLGALTLRLRCWRELITQGLRRSATPDSTRLCEQLRDERRVRLGAFVAAGVTVALLPIPPTWVRFWFALGVASVVLSTMSLVALRWETATFVRRRFGPPVGPPPRQPPG